MERRGEEGEKGREILREREGERIEIEKVGEGEKGRKDEGERERKGERS